MAEYHASWRSNYFQVKDKADFERWTRLLEIDWAYREVGAEGAPVYLYSLESEIPSIFYDEDIETDLELDFAGDLAEHLCVGEVAILIEVGNEKASFMNGRALIINHEGLVDDLSLVDWAITQAEAHAQHMGWDKPSAPYTP